MDLRERLRSELARRRGINPRYSLRALARSLGTDHSALVRILSPRHRLTRARIDALGSRLGLTHVERDAAWRHEQGELVLALVDRPGFVPSTRWIATRAGLSLDEVGVTLHRLLFARRLTMTSANVWTKEPAA